MKCPKCLSKKGVRCPFPVVALPKNVTLVCTTCGIQYTIKFVLRDSA